MVTPELVAYIQQELSLGDSFEIIKDKLLASGWSEEDIIEGIATATHPQAKQYVQPVSTFKKTHLEFGNLFTQSWIEFKNNWKIYILVQIIGITLILISWLPVMIVGYLLRSSLSLYSFTGIIISVIDVIFRFVVSYLPALTGYILLYAVVDEEHTLKVHQYFKSAVYNGWKLSLLIALTGIVAVGPGFVLYFIAKTIEKVFSLSFGLSGLILIITTVISVIIGLISLSWFILGSYVLVAEKTGIIESLKRSKRCARFHELRILINIVLLSLSFYIFNIIPILGNLIFYFILIPFNVIYLYKLYKNLRFEAETRGI